jgi:hypothetical protein
MRYRRRILYAGDNTMRLVHRMGLRRWSASPRRLDPWTIPSVISDQINSNIESHERIWKSSMAIWTVAGRDYCSGRSLKAHRWLFGRHLDATSTQR